jgi:hypothetical protein
LPLGRLDPRWWAAIGGVLICADYATGPKPQFPVFYIIPVTLAAWYSGRWSAVALGTTIPLFHALFLMMLWKPSESRAMLVAMTAARGTVVIAMGLWFARLSEYERDLRHQVRTLEGLLPICAFCKRIRNEAGHWDRLEAFIAARSEARFSHAFCPSCWKTHYSELGDPPADSVNAANSSAGLPADASATLKSPAADAY